MESKKREQDRQEQGAKKAKKRKHNKELETWGELVEQEKGDSQGAIRELLELQPKEQRLNRRRTRQVSIEQFTVVEAPQGTPLHPAGRDVKVIELEITSPLEESRNCIAEISGSSQANEGMEPNIQKCLNTYIPANTKVKYSPPMPPGDNKRKCYEGKATRPTVQLRKLGAPSKNKN